MTEQNGTGRSNNAFSELMKPKPKPTIDEGTKKTTWQGSAGLGSYTRHPETFPRDRVVYYNDKFVVINDLYPKASVHLLILPRDQKLNTLEPQKAFDKPEFLQDCREELVKVRKLVASELRRKYGRYSQSDRPYFEAMEEDEPPENMPAGRDWEKEVISGIHAVPSMGHIHIHVLSRDMNSEYMNKKAHYLSFTTDFLVDLDEFPLAKNDRRRHYGNHTLKDMHCWRCKENYTNQFSKLKKHLDMELEQWIKE